MVMQVLRKLDLGIDVNNTQTPQHGGRLPREKLPAKEYNYILKLLEDNINLIAHVLGDDLQNVVLPNSEILKQITSIGSKRIITDNERSKITHSNRVTLNAISSSGSGEIITTVERNKLKGITNIGSGLIITSDERQKIGTIVAPYIHPATHPATMITFTQGHSNLVSDTVQKAIIELNGKINQNNQVGLIFNGLLDVSSGLPDVTNINNNVFYEAMNNGSLTLNSIDTNIEAGDWIMYFGGEQAPFWELRMKPSRVKFATAQDVTDGISNDVIMSPIRTKVMIDNGLGGKQEDLGGTNERINGVDKIVFPNRLTTNGIGGDEHTPTDPEDVVNKKYVDNGLNGKISKNGGTVTGTLNLGRHLTIDGYSIRIG